MVAPIVHIAACSVGDEEYECDARIDHRGVEPMLNGRNGRATGWNAISWRGNTKHSITGSPFQSVDEAAKAWDASTASGSNGLANLGSWINFPPPQPLKAPKFPLGSRTVLTRKGKPRQSGVLSAFIGKGKYQIKPEDGECSVVSLPSPMVTVFPHARLPYRVSDKMEDSDEIGSHSTLKKLHSVCEKYPTTHVLGALGLAIGGVRTLWRQCRRSGIVLHQSCTYAKSSFDVLKPLAQALSVAIVAAEENPITLQAPVLDGFSAKGLCSDSISTGDAVRVTLKDRKNSSRAMLNDDERASKVGKSSTDVMEVKLSTEGHCDSSMRAKQDSEARKALSIIDGAELIVDLPTDDTVPILVGEVTLGSNCEKERRADIETEDSSLLLIEFGSAQMDGQRESLVVDDGEEKVNVISVSGDDKALNGTVSSKIVSSEIKANDLDRKLVVDVDNTGRGTHEVTGHPTSPADQDVNGIHDSSHQQQKVEGNCDLQLHDDVQVSQIRQSYQLPSSERSPGLALISKSGRNDADRDSKIACHIKTENCAIIANDVVPGMAMRNPPDPPSPRRRALRPAKVPTMDRAPVDKANVNDASLRQKLKRSAAPNVAADEVDKPKSGPKVEVRYKGEWFVANVLKKKADQALVRYLGADGGYGTTEWVKEDRIRPVQTQPESECNLDPQKLIGVSAINGEQGLTLWTASIKIRNKEVSGT